jgi:hypothetical protein
VDAVLGGLDVADDVDGFAVTVFIDVDNDKKLT